MSKNPLYQNEIATAAIFIEEHKYDASLMALLKYMENPLLFHSDRWSMAYDYLVDNYPEYKDLSTGMAYYVED